ncbi:glycoside hydrolase family 88 protein [Coraliomargarita algicola]|uniref:Glycoside hydrolase family 88 protein n=1 Tax=Coraliomargarita algicola TaxID=3092156 RepID=A0ABZ0RMH0_9BACT|nr:glycoside hydrolase family 88 protein [Coraliomargarita sp. J2-16]WPJ96298.1 glycoside hydrolase family 88 protein [Coraliomargarita sp. J2-16]
MNKISIIDTEEAVSDAVSSVTHVPATSVLAPTVEVPSGKRIPFAWRDFSVGKDCEVGTTILRWEEGTVVPEGTFRLRLAVSLDIRHTIQVEARDSETGVVFGVFDFTQAPVFQIAEIPLTREFGKRVLQVGVELRQIDGSVDLRFFAPSANSPTLLQPHLMVAGAAETADVWGEFLERFRDLSTVQTFSWMEGCLLEGGYDLNQRYAQLAYETDLKRRLRLYLNEHDLIYENPRSEPVDNSIYGIEGTLPFAVIGRLYPEHASVQRAVDFWLSRKQPDGHFASGAIMDGSMLSAEGSLCVAYPLVVIARRRGDVILEELALDQFRIRRDLLVSEDGSIYLRNRLGDLSFRNWARGITWYYLGLVRGIIELNDRKDIEDLRREAHRVMHYLLSYQLENGLWTNFIHQPSSGMDTSGSAGIAAALALAYQHGILPIEARQAAARTKDGLVAYLTADGLLEGGTPSNRAGEGSGQRRVIFPVGMGLAAQLLVALDPVDDSSSCVKES